MERWNLCFSHESNNGTFTPDIETYTDPADYIKCGPYGRVLGVVVSFDDGSVAKFTKIKE